MDKSNSEKYNVFMKLFWEAHPSMKKETHILKAKNYGILWKNGSEKLSHEIAKLKVKAANIKSKNFHMRSSFLKPSSAAPKILREENVPQVKEHPDEAIVVDGKSIQIIVQLFSMLELWRK